MTNDVFGEKLVNQTYVDREGVYAVILNDKNEVANGSVTSWLFFYLEVV